jgi:caffeoyl-CoA O-methyltransferase
MNRGAIKLPAKLYDYIVAHGTRETAVQRRLRRVTGKLPLAQMQIGPDQAAAMQMLVRVMRARRCLEIASSAAT